MLQAVHSKTRLDTTLSLLLVRHKESGRTSTTESTIRSNSAQFEVGRAALACSRFAASVLPARYAVCSINLHSCDARHVVHAPHTTTELIVGKLVHARLVD